MTREPISVRTSQRNAACFSACEQELSGWKGNAKCQPSQLASRVGAAGGFSWRHDSRENEAHLVGPCAAGQARALGKDPNTTERPECVCLYSVCALSDSTT